MKTRVRLAHDPGARRGQAGEGDAAERGSRTSIRQQLAQTKKNEAMTKWVEDLKKDYEARSRTHAGFTPPPGRAPPPAARPPTQHRIAGCALGEALRRAAGADASGCAATAPGTASRRRARSSRTPSRRPTRSRTRRSRGDDGEAARRARRPALPGLLPGAAARGAGRRATSSRWRAVVHAKLVRRHPHVFGDVEARHRRPRARALGADQDRAGGPRRHLPRRARRRCRRCCYARKVQRRAAAVGFD